MILSAARVPTVFPMGLNTSVNTNLGSRTVMAYILIPTVVNIAVRLLMEYKRGRVSELGAQKQNWRVTATSGNLDAIKWRGMERTAMLTAPHTSVTSRMV